MAFDGKIIAEWNTFEEAKRAIGLKDASTISKCAHNIEGQKTAYGYRWSIQYGKGKTELNVDTDDAARLFEIVVALDSEATAEALKNIIKRYDK